MPRRLSVLASFALLSLALAACEPRNPPIPEVWADPSIPEYQPSSTLPPATGEGATPDGSLLESYAARTYRSEADLRNWMLPFQAKTMDVELLIAAAKDDPERMALLLAPNARWGAPDRRELRARPIVTKQDPLGLEFLQAFRTASSRFGKKASFSCTPLQPGWQTLVASGAEPEWCMYVSNDQLDIISFRMIMIGDRLKTDYVGFYPEREAAAVRTIGAGSPPPMTPYIKRPVSLELPELMPDGSNPVLEKKRPRVQPQPQRPAQPAGDDAPIPVPATPN